MTRRGNGANSVSLMENNDTSVIAVKHQLPHEMGWDVWSWSGYTVEALMRQARRDAELADMLGQIDVLVDGPFQLVHRAAQAVAASL